MSVAAKAPLLPTTVNMYGDLEGGDFFAAAPISWLKDYRVKKVQHYLVYRLLRHQLYGLWDIQTVSRVKKESDSGSE